MKTIFFFLILMTQSAFAQKIWVQAPDSFLKAGDISYSEYQLGKIKNAPSNPELITWGQSWLERTSIDSPFFDQMEKIENDSILTAPDRAFIMDLLAKIGDRVVPSQKIKSQKLLCKWATLDSKADFASGAPMVCAEKALRLANLKDKYDFINGVTIEDVYFDLSRNPAPLLDENAVYNWKLLSNSHRMISFRGSFADLKSQNFVVEKLVQGDCDSFTHSIDDLELLSRAWVYFSPECQKDLQKNETSKIGQWYDKNKSWVIPVGLVVLGAAAYGLRNKTLVITKP